MRSGTTLLYRLLNHHPQIALLYESDLFALGPLLWPSLRKGVWGQRLDFWNGALARHGIEGDMARTLPSRVQGPAEALEVLGRAYARHKPVAYLGSKSIHHCDRLPTIARAFPDARFVVLWRPMAEIMDSLQRAGRTNAYLTPARRRRQLFQQYSQLAEGVLALRRLGHSVHEVLYSELVTNPEAACRELCNFLGLPWSPQMLARDSASLSAIPDEAHHFHARSTPVGLVSSLPPELQVEVAAQVRSYERYWAVQFAGQPVRLAPRSALPPGPGRRFFALERWLDGLFYHTHRRLVFVKLLIYRFAPLTCLRWYRNAVRASAQRQTGRAKLRLPGFERSRRRMPSCPVPFGNLP